MKKVPNLPIGAVELIIECQQLLTGERKHLGSTDVYVERRRRYWESQAERPQREPGEPEDIELAA
jgi:predicted nucleotidyltransferase